MHKNVYTIAVLPAKSDTIEKLLETLESLAKSTRQESGCIEYGFYRDSNDANCVLSFERWVDQASEDAHWKTPHLKKAIESMDELLATKPQIYKTQRII